MFGGRWIQDGGSHWRLVWSERAIKDFYLNNILIHELGHLLDDRNSGYVDRERFAEWFALEHGYKIAVIQTTVRHHGIDTPEQYEAFVERQRNR